MSVVMTYGTYSVYHGNHGFSIHLNMHGINSENIFTIRDARRRIADHLKSMDLNSDVAFDAKSTGVRTTGHERVSVHPLVACWLLRNGYSFRYEFDIGEGCSPDFVGHKNGRFSVVEAKRHIGDLQTAIRQIERYKKTLAQRYGDIVDAYIAIPDHKSIRRFPGIEFIPISRFDDCSAYIQALREVRRDRFSDTEAIGRSAWKAMKSMGNQNGVMKFHGLEY